LVGGIDLADIVGPAGGVTLGVGLASGRGGGLLGQEEPALEGAGGGEGLVGVEILQDEAEEGGTPGGMLVVEEEDLVAEGVRRRGRALGGGVVRGEGVGTAGAEALEEVLDGAEFEAQRLGDNRRGLVEEEEAMPNLLTKRARQRLRHGGSPGEKVWEKALVSIVKLRNRAKLDVAISRKT